jgi:hypothetical protein
MVNITDCLVLCIDDLTTVKIFIIYDVNKKKFIIRGKNYDSDSDSESESEYDTDSESASFNSESDVNCLNKPFSFQCKLKKQLIPFLNYLISVNSFKFTLYNYDNLPNSSNEISYEFLEDLQDERYEIVSYKEDIFDKKMCLNLLNILKNIYNEY